MIISKEELARANGWKLNDPILNFYSNGDIEIPDNLRIKLARGLYKGKDDDYWK